MDWGVQKYCASLGSIGRGNVAQLKLKGGRWKFNVSTPSPFTASSNTSALVVHCTHTPTFLPNRGYPSSNPPPHLQSTPPPLLTPTPSQVLNFPSSAGRKALVVWRYASSGSIVASRPSTVASAADPNRLPPFIQMSLVS